MTAQSETHFEYDADGGACRDPAPPLPGAGGEQLLAALLDGMDAGLCAFDTEGVVTHWNREAERLLGWTRAEAVGRRWLTDWAVRPADAADVRARLLGAMGGPDRRVHEFALLRKNGGRVLVRAQLARVRGGDGRPAGVYCAFTEVHAQIGLERSIALSEALLEKAPWGVVLVDADLRPAAANIHAARALGVDRAAMLGRPLGDLLRQGAEELECALQHVLAQGSLPGPAELWVALRPAGGEAGCPDGLYTADGPGGRGGRRCWRSSFLKLASPMEQEPVPMGAAWFFLDVTDTKRAEQETARLRFRDSQLHRAARAAAECGDPMEAAVLHLDFALAGFADHALLDLAAGGGASPAYLLRAAEAPAPGAAAKGLPTGYAADHPALQAYERCGPVRASAGGAAVREWARARGWPEGTVHGLCAVLRSRGRTVGVVTFLRGSSRRAFDRADAAYAEDVANRVAAAVDLAGCPS